MGALALGLEYWAVADWIVSTPEDFTSEEAGGKRG